MIIRICIIALCISLTALSAANTTDTSNPALMLSPLIKQNKLEEARNASQVNNTLFLNITSYSGFLTVDEKYNSNIFFWYFPVNAKPVNETPWIIWFAESPEISSLSGLFNDVGPIEYLVDKKKLNRREWSWAANYSLLFVDTPVGAGFSFTNSNVGLCHNMKECSNHLYVALQQFLTIFPELRAAPLYLAGESYAGRYIPVFGNKILEEKPTGDALVNLTGLILGSPVIDPIDTVDMASVYYHWGLIDIQGRMAAKPLQDQYKQAIEQNHPEEARSLLYKLEDFLSDLSQHTNLRNVLEETDKMEGSEARYNPLHDFNEMNEFEDLFKRPDIVEALHVGGIRFTFSNFSIATALKKEFLQPIQPKMENLLEHYKILIYCGQLELKAPCELGAESRRKRWRWSRRDDFLRAPRRPWTYNNTVAGYVKEGGGLTEVLVQGATHYVHMDAPAAASSLLTHFVSDDKLPQPTHFKDKPEYTPPYTDEPLPQPQPTPKKNDALIASVVLNVLLLICLLGSIILYMKYKRRSENFFYSTVEDSISDGILTMT